MTASIFLVGFYLLIKFVDKDIINLLISIFFCVTTIISTSEILEGLLKLPDSMKKVLVHVKTHPYIKKYL